MATLKMRYGGNVVSLPEGANFSPGNFGTARFKFRVNSTSVGEFGLTTNTNAKEYCKLQMRIGGQICFIGRVSTTSYISGANVDYHGSSTGSMSSQSASASESKQSNVTLPIDYYSSSMATSTSQYTQVTSTEQIETRSYTQEVLTRVAEVTYDNGSGNSTSSNEPSIRTVTNATGSTVTTRKASGQVLTNSSFRESCKHREQIDWRLVRTVLPGWSWDYRNKSSMTQNLESFLSVDTRITASTQWNTHFAASSTASTNGGSWGATTVNVSGYPTGNAYTQNGNGKTSTYYTTGTAVNGGDTYSYSSSTYVQSTNRKHTFSSQNVTKSSVSIYRSSLRSMTWRVSTGSTSYGSYSTRWTYWWTSCKRSTASYYSTNTIREYSTRSYSGTTYYSSITRSTTSVSETIHNMNI